MIEKLDFNDKDIKPDRQSHSVALFIKQAKKFPILSRDEEKIVAIRAAAGDKEAVKTLIQSNLLLAVKIAYEYKSLVNNFDDLIQESNLGLCRSMEKYDPKRGYRFSTYAGWWCRSMILRYIFNNSHMIKPGTTNDQKKLFYNLRKEQKRLETLGVDTDTFTIAQNLNVSEENVIEMDSRLRNDIYLDAPSFQEDDDSNVKTMKEYIASTEERPDNVLEHKDFYGTLRVKLDGFARRLKNNRQREIFYDRIIAEEPITLKELGDRFGVSKERMRQVEEEILLKLKKQLKSFVYE